MKYRLLWFFALFLASVSKLAYAQDIVCSQDGNRWVFHNVPAQNTSFSRSDIKGEEELEFQCKNGKIEGQLKILSTRPLFYNPIDLVENKPRWFRVPVIPGEKWNYKEYVRYTGQTSGKWIYSTVEVYGLGDVQVPAGTFQAYKIVLTGDNKVSTYYYSIHTGSLLKFESDQAMPGGGHIVASAKLTAFDKPAKKAEPK